MSYDEQRRYRERRRAKALAYLGGSCVQCGWIDDLQFDHRDPVTKVIAIAEAITAGWSWNRLLVELDKCQLLCKPHHLDKSVGEGSLAGAPWNRIDNPSHGTGVMYDRGKCRCSDCKEWKALYRKGLVNNQGMPD